MTEDKHSAFSQKLLRFESGDRERILNAYELTQGYSSVTAISAEAAVVLLDLGMDAATVAAALIRRLPEAAGQASPAALSLVRGVQKIGGLKTNTKTIYEAQNIRNMIFALTEDIRVIFIELAEKLAMLRILDSSPGDERKATARECLDIYAPLADRLGISWIKNEMEDLSLKFLNRETYQQIKNLVAEKRGQRSRFLEHIRETLKAETELAGIDVEVETRAKHFYSVYMKMRKRGISAEKIYDLSGIRVICNSIENCYTLLGIVHRLWRPVSGCFNDYIANPKPNGYQSLHTTVMIEEETGAPDDEGRPLEIQIRTREMHQFAEYGVASHWLYKKGSSRDMVLPEEIGVVNKLKDWMQNRQGSGELPPSWLEDIKSEILRKWVYVFTPQGKVIKLPAGATPIDFAYYIHSAVGEHCMGAKVNGAIFPLSSPLRNTQVVEILTSQAAHPHFNWLELAKSSKARGKIRAWLEKNDETAGRKPIPEAPVVPPAVSQGRGRKEEPKKVNPPLAPLLSIRVENEKNIMIRFAHCCNPAAGDSIIGYVSRGRGIIIHREDCTSIVRNTEFEKRKIRVEWEKAESAEPMRSKTHRISSVPPTERRGGHH